MSRTLLLSLSIGLFACGGGNPSPPPTTPPPSEEAPVPVAEQPATEAQPAARKRKPFEVYSSCGEVASVAFAADPKAPNVDKRPIAPGGTLEGPRNDDGNQTVWLLDDKAEPIAKVNVTRGMKRVEIGKSCRTLDAR